MRCAVLWCKCLFFHTHTVQAHTLTQRRCYNRPHRYDDGCDSCRKDTAQVQGPNSLSSNTADHTHDRQPLQTHRHTCIQAECRAEYTALHESTWTDMHFTGRAFQGRAFQNTGGFYHTGSAACWTWCRLTGVGVSVRHQWRSAAISRCAGSIGLCYCWCTHCHRWSLAENADPETSECPPSSPIERRVWKKERNAEMDQKKKNKEQVRNAWKRDVEQKPKENLEEEIQIDFRSSYMEA